MTHLLLEISAKCLFHGTNITVYQRNESSLPHKTFIYENKTHFKSSVSELPESYKNIMPTKRGKSEFPNNKLQPKSFFPSLCETRNEANAWLDVFQQSVKDTNVSLSFSTFIQVILTYIKMYQT